MKKLHKKLIKDANIYINTISEKYSKNKNDFVDGFKEAINYFENKFNEKHIKK
jgi:hypothetical protein